MNLVLLEPRERGGPLPAADVRTRHVLEVLRRGVGDRFDAGIVDGPRGVATISALDAAGLHFRFEPTVEPPPLAAITLIVATPRPATAKDVLRDATTLGVCAIHFVHAERCTPSYATASLWTAEAVGEQLRLGAAQAFDTRLPVVTWGRPLAAALAEVATNMPVVALDNYEATVALGALRPPAPITLAFGPERGWGPRDREQLRAAGATLAHLGSRVLRLETAVTAAVAIVAAGS